MGRKYKEIVTETNERGCKLVISHYKDSDGYVQVKRDGKTQFLHRYVYEKEHGKISEGLVIRHKCDNPSCINIDHLELGTHRDNMNDMKVRGRYHVPEALGAKNGNATLNEDIVKLIKLDTTSTNVALGKKYGVHHATISAIRKGKIWSHIVV